MLKPLLTGNSLELIFDADSNLPPLYTDEGKVSQILRNLISNALKFTRRGHVRITAQLEGEGFIAFQVADTGIGIAPDDREKIFEEFVQVESDLQAKVKGTGLGLPLSRRLAELLGGSISVESEVGLGSTFFVRLPIRYAESEGPQVDSLPPRSRMGRGHHPFCRGQRRDKLCSRVLVEKTNYRLLFARNIPEARAVMRTTTPSIVALDRFIDGEDCLFYIQELKSAGYAGPVVVISVVDDQQAALGAGADQFLTKPVPPFKLASTLRELLEGQGSHTVLLADDDEVTRYLLGEALTRLGYDVVEARDGREAIQMMGSHILTGVFLDIVMPDLTGFEVLREMRRSPSTESIPVIVHTSKDLSPQEADSLTDLGAVIYPKREFSSTEGSEKLREVLATAGF